MAILRRDLPVFVLLLALTLTMSAIPGAVPPSFTSVTTLASSSLLRPLGATIDPSTGIVYVADSKNSQIKAITEAGAVSVLAGSGVPGFVDGVRAAARFHEPAGIVFDPVQKVLYVTELRNHAIRRVTLDGVVTTIAGSGKQGFRNGDGAAAAFNSPAAIAIAADGALLVADSGNNVIRRISGVTATTFAGSGQSGSADGAAAAARFASPEGIAVRADGAVFVADTGNHRIRMIASGNVTTISGSVAGAVDGAAAVARFRDPHGLAFDEAGTLYVADTGNGTIRKIDAALAGVTTLTGSPDRRNAPRPVDGTLATATLSEPWGMVYAGALFVADARHDAVRAVEPQLLLTSVSPDRGPRAGGTSVTITGSGFVPGTIGISFGSAAATDVKYESATRLIATTPAGTGPVDVKVTLRGRSATLQNGYTYASPPTITSLSPVKGPQSGGQLITINGSELDASTRVFFGSVAATSVVVESTTRLTVTTPASAAGVVGVTVRTDTGEATLANAYTFAAPPVISSFAPSAARVGSSVTIHGTNFDSIAANNDVRFAGIAAQILTASTTDLVVVVPAGASSGRISVTTAGGTGASSTDFVVVSITSLTIVPPTASVEVGETTQLHAMGVRSDGSQVDVSADVVWSTTNTLTISLLSSGSVRGLSTGTATVKATLGTFEAIATITVVPPTPLPPDPSVVAPPLDETVNAPLSETTAFLYTGPNPIQSGVAPDTIEAERAAVIRGRVLNRDGLALRGVRVAIRDHEELGWTLSRADGAFDLAVNAGGSLVLEYTKNGYLPAHRSVDSHWRSYDFAPDVVLVPLDEAATRVVLNAPAAQVARGSSVTDDDGARQATLIVPPGTTASMKMPDGSTQALDTITVRATEYSVGDHGLQSMPAALPPSSGYTYCVELSADEAIAAGATDVTFNAPLAFYVENFLDFPVGGIVPAGYYDRQRGVWVPSKNGVVIRIVSISGGVAAIDTNGDNLADPPSTLATFGITSEEQTRLGSMYAAGKSLWRVQIAHFTPWDCNWPYGPPNDATAPKNGKPNGKDAKSNNPSKCSGSIIECENQTLGESIPIEGTPFTLNYRSDRVNGRTLSHQLNIPVSGSSVPGSLKAIQVVVSAEGKQWSTEVPGAPNQSLTFTWDGRDAYGRPVPSATKANVSITYVYPAVYQQPGNFAESFGRFSGIPLSGSRDRAEIFISQTSEARIEGIHQNFSDGIGGWSLSGHQAYNAHAETLYKGSGDRSNGTVLAPIIDRYAGQYEEYDETGDGGPALNAKMIFPWYVTAAPDGSVYVADAATESVRKVDPDGIITHVTGNEHSQGSLDHNGESAASAKIYGPYNMAIGPDGALYENDARRINVIRDGTITTIAGNGTCCKSTGDGGPARAAGIDVYGIAVDKNGVLYLADPSAIRKVENGIITSVTKPDCFGTQLSGPVSQACVWAYNIAFGPDGLLYGITGDAIWRITAGGIVEMVAGCNGCRNTAVDGSSALSGRVSSRTTWGFDIGPDGTFYFSDDAVHTVRAVTPDGIINTIAGDTTVGHTGDGGPATAAQMLYPWGVTVGPDGVLYISDSDWGVVRKFVRPYPSFSNAESLIGSADGEELYVFNGAGRHLRTIGRRGGEVRRQFSYDAEGRLVAVNDTTAGTTTIQRDSDGNPVAIIAPGGQRTDLALDDGGNLKSVTNAATNESYALTYGDGGLLQSLKNPAGKISTFGYDGNGALVTDSGPDVGTKTVSRTVSGLTINATVTSSMGRTFRVFSQERSDKSTLRIFTSPAGTATQSITSSNGKTVQTRPNGVIFTSVDGADPRFGMSAPVTKEISVALPSGLTNRRTSTRAVTLANADDPLSLLTETNTYNINGRVSTSVFDANARTITTRSPLGRVTVTSVNGANHLAGVQVAGLDSLSFSYNGGQLGSMVYGGRSWTVGYDSNHRMSSIVDPTGRSVAMTYDAAGRLQTQTMSGSLQIGYSWDTSGNLRTITTPGGRVHTFGYTNGDRVASYTPPQGSGTGIYQFTYNGDGQLGTILQPNHATLTFGYDGGGRLATISGAQRQLAYEYLGNGNVGRVTAPGGSVAFTYDGALLTGITSDGPVSSNVSWTYNNDFAPTTESVGGSSIALGYDNDGMLVRSGDLVVTRDPGNGSVSTITIGKLAETYHYNSHGEVQDYSVTFDGAPLTSYAYGRDGAGRITSITRPDALTGFSYDDAGRLHTVSAGTSPASEYLYDANGNRKTHLRLGGREDGTYDEQDRLITYGDTTYTYTPNGELETWVKGGVTTSFAYDSFGNLRNVNTPGMAIEYLVDAMNRRVGKKVNGTLVRGWMYAGGARIVAETDATGAIVSRFVYGMRPNVPDYFVRGGETYRIIANQNGSPELIVNVATGAVMQRIEYSEFGEVISDSNPGFQPFGFGGGLYDRDTGFVRFGVRDYDTFTGRWTTKDPIGFAGGDTNFYAYALNDPINLIDPMGTDWLQNLSDFSAGFGSTLSFGLTDWINEKTGASAVVNKCSGWHTAGKWSGVALQTAIGAEGLPSGLRMLPNAAKGAIGEGLSIAENTLQGSELLGTQVSGQGLGLSTVFDSVWTSSSGELYYVESKFGTAGLTSAQRAAARALGDSYHVERWGYPFFRRVGGYVGFGAGAASAMSGSGGDCGCN